MPRHISSQNLSIEEDLRQQLFVIIQQTGGNPSQLLDLLSVILEHRAWEKLHLSFPEFITLPFDRGGAGWSVENVRAILTMKHRYEGSDPFIAAKMAKLRRDVDDLLIPVAASHGGRHNRGQAKQGAVVIFKKRQGNSRVDTLSRLKRDRPDLAQKVLDGELTSNRAAILAGFRARSIQFYPDDVMRTAQAIQRHMSTNQIKALVIELSITINQL